MKKRIAAALFFLLFAVGSALALSGPSTVSAQLPWCDTHDCGGSGVGIPRCPWYLCGY